MSRMRVLAAVVAVSLVLAGCAPSPDPAPSPTATASSSPTPTPEPEAVVPFDGECAAALSDAEVAELLGAGAVQPVLRTLSTIEPDLGASLALIGGLSCSWLADAGFLGIAVFPVDVVPPSVSGPVTSMSCEEGLCSGASVVGDAWVYAHAGTEPAAIGALDRVSERVAQGTDPRAATASSEWWSIPACADLAPAVEAGVAMPGLEPGFPGDSGPGGVSWDTAVANGVDAWCPWYSFAGLQPVIVELDIQPGIGVPDAGLLAEASATPIEVAGAEAAFLVPDAPDAGVPRVVAVSGANRLTVTGKSGMSQESLSAVAANVLAVLDQS